MQKECKHQWARLMAEHNKKLIPTAVYTCLNCGVLRVGKRTIKISRHRLDMGGKPILNASELHGIVYYS